MNTNGQTGIFQIGDVLNNTYRIEAVLGKGGTSEVYRARSEISQRVMAIKALRHEYSGNEDFLALMTREEDMREIRHDAIVRYFDNQRTDSGLVYLVMDYVEGPGMDAKLKEGGMSAEDLMIIARRLTEGLAACHARNIVHRDLSPDNVILRGGDPAEAVIIDFGIAKDSNPGAQTIVGNEFAGKYAYAAPEQLSGQTDQRSDIFSLGALLLATFRGAKPDMGANPMDVVERKKQPLDTSGVPEPLKSLIDRMTAPDPQARLQSAQAVLDMLDGRGPADPVAALLAEDLSDKTIIKPAKPVPEPPQQPKLSPPPQKSRSLLPVLLVLMVVLAGGAGAFFAGLLDPLIPSRGLPVADPYTLLAERNSEGETVVVGHVPDAQNQTSIAALIESMGGTADLEIARGEIAVSWGADVETLLGQLTALPEWRLLMRGDAYKVTGLTNDRAERAKLLNSLQTTGALSGEAAIELGPRILSTSAITPLLESHADCGALAISEPPDLGYPQGAEVVITGRFAEVQSRVGLTDALSEVAGDRPIVMKTELLNPALCTVEQVLPQAPPGGFEIRFGFGDRDDDNPSGRYLVGENPVIDVNIPSWVTGGYLYVSALDVSGNVFHMLPNINRSSNAVETLRDGRTGPIDLRVAYGMSEVGQSKKLAFTIDASSLGKTKIIVLHSKTPLFESNRPTVESAGGFAQALAARNIPVSTLDSRILTSLAQ